MTWRLNNSKASVRLKTKGALGKHCTPLDKVFFPQKYGLTILKAQYVNARSEKLSKQMTEGGSETLEISKGRKLE